MKQFISRNMVKIFMTVSLLLFTTVMLTAQLPKSNIYLFNMTIESDSVFKFSKPRFLTHFNQNGYNNQPSFFSKEELYITVGMPFENQTDIYSLDLQKRTKTRVTSTLESEYSPVRMMDYYSFSAVRQEISGKDTLQRIWQFPIDRLSNGKPILKYTTDIGYYQWLNSYQVALFKASEASELVIADTYTDKENHIAFNVGRCLKTAGASTLYYIQKADDRPWMIMELNLYSGQSKKVLETVPGSEDFELLTDGTILMAKGSKLYKYNRYEGDNDWIEIANFRYYDIANITRIAVEGGQIALVAD